MPWLDVDKIMKAERTRQWFVWRRAQSGTGRARSPDASSDGAIGRDRFTIEPSATAAEDVKAGGP